MARLAAKLPAGDVDGFAEAVGRFLREMAGPRTGAHTRSARTLRHFWLLMAYIDGCLAHQLAVPDPNFGPTPAIRTLLRGMLKQ